MEVGPPPLCQMFLPSRGASVPWQATTLTLLPYMWQSYHLVKEQPQVRFIVWLVYQLTRTKPREDVNGQYKRPCVNAKNFAGTT